MTSKLGGPKESSTREVEIIKSAFNCSLSKFQTTYKIVKVARRRWPYALIPPGSHSQHIILQRLQGYNGRVYLKRLPRNWLFDKAKNISPRLATTVAETSLNMSCKTAVFDLQICNEFIQSSHPGNSFHPRLAY